MSLGYERKVPFSGVLMAERRAGGHHLTELCGRLATLPCARLTGVNLRQPDAHPRDITRIEYIQKKQANDLTNIRALRKIKTEKDLRTKLISDVPCFGQKHPVTAESIDRYQNSDGARFISLVLAEDDMKELRSARTLMRQSIESTLGQVLSWRGIVLPSIRLAYAEKTVEQEHVDAIESVISDALRQYEPFVVDLLPIHFRSYGRPV